MRRQIEWNVPAQTAEDSSSSPSVLESLSRISRAALLVKVMARMDQGAVGSAMNCGRISAISSVGSPAASSSAATASSVISGGTVSEA